MKKKIMLLMFLTLMSVFTINVSDVYAKCAKCIAGSHSSCTSVSYSYSNSSGQCKQTVKCCCSTTIRTNYYSHTGGTATCTAAKKCTRCGSSYGSSLGHTGGTATCTAAKKCTRCGISYGSSLGHDYTAATSCTLRKKCSRCTAVSGSHSYTVATSCTLIKKCSGCSLTSGGHSYTVTSYSSANATYHYTKKCSGCTLRSTLVSHTFNVSAATCTVRKYCTTCSYEAEAALNHDWSTTWTTNTQYHWHKCTRCTLTIDTVPHSGGTATCTAAKKCSTCGVSYGSLDSTNHSWNAGTTTKAATCTATGTIKYTCTRDSSHTKTETIPMKSHIYDETPGVYSTSATQHWKQCINCSNKKDVGNHTGGTATCTAAKTCSTCGESYGSALNHNYSTSWTQGATNHWHACTRCGATSGSAAHTFLWDVSTPGYHTKKCTVCGYTTDRGTHSNRIPTPAEMASGPTIKLATCTSGGTTYFICSVCKFYTPTSTAALGHNYVWNNANSSTTHEMKCTRCGDSYEETHKYGSWEKYNTNNHKKECTVCGYIVTQAHSWGSWTSTGYGTSQTHKRTCSVCNETQSGNHSYGSWYKVSETQHRQDCTTSGCPSYGLSTHNGAVTCTEQAYCSTCKGYWGTPTGHNWSSWKPDTYQIHIRLCSNCGAQETGTHIPDVAATCTEPETCKVCSYQYKPALGHSYGEWTNYNSISHKRLCSRCNKYDYQNHIAGSSATCLEPQKCTICKTILVDTLGHNWNAGVITTPATCTTNGVKTFTCTRDSSHTYTEVVPKTGHTPGAPATCLEPQKCTVCGAILVNALGHDYSLPCPTCNKANIICSRCGDEKAHACDITKPIITVTPTENSVYQKTNEITITAYDEGGSGLASTNAYEYYLSNSATALSDGAWTRYTNGGKTIIGADKTGEYYLFIKKVSDAAGNVSTESGTETDISGETYHRFGIYMLDNEMPTPGTLLTKYNQTDNVSTYINGDISRQDVYLEVVNGNDSVSGHKETTYKIYKDGEEIPKVSILTTNGTYTIKVYTEDNAGNIAEQTASYIVVLEKPVETKIVIRNLRDDGIGIITKVTIQIVEETYVNGEMKYVERVEPIEKIINASNQNDPIEITRGLTPGNYKAVILLTDKLGNERKMETDIFTVN